MNKVAKWVKYVEKGTWKTSDGTGIGPALGPLLRGSFATIVVIENDPMEVFNGTQNMSPDNADLDSYAS